MSWKNVRLIFMREVRDQLRDRRTLFMIAILPLLLYPVMGIVMVQMTLLFSEQPRTVVILGADHLPAPPLVEDNRFVSNWFQVPQDAEKLHVVTEADLKPEKGDRPDDRVVQLIGQARKIRKKLEEKQELEKDKERAEKLGDDAEAFWIAKRLNRLRDELGDLFSRSQIQVLIIVPEGFRENVEEVNRLLARRKEVLEVLSDYERPTIVQNSADEKSQIAYSRVKEALSAWEQSILKQRLDLAHLPETLPTPVNPSPIDLAESSQLSANLWSKLFPALLVIMAATGAFYPAIDLGAGEKERGTMETLLICPATRTEIVVGKFFTVLLFSMSTAILNLLSMGLTAKYMFSLADTGALTQVGSVSFPSWLSMIWVGVLLIPLSVLFSALCLSLATFARSTKEGQYYLAPLLVVTLVLTIFCLFPAVEITPFYSVMPVMGIALLLKGLLLSPVDAMPLYLYAIPVLATSIGYSVLALWWAIDQFNREDVLFREAERFELRLWIRHLLRDKESMPSFTEAGFCFILIMILQFVAMKYMGQSLSEAPPEMQPTRILQLLMVQQLVIIACPALFMGILLTTSVRQTFRLRLPGGKMLATAAALPLVLHPLSIELARNMDWFFPKLPENARRALEVMTDPSQPWWLVLLSFAVIPAICEELAYRGFILSGFGRSRRTWLAIVLSSLTFGIMHLFPQQVFNATLLGLVLGLLAVRSGSLFSGVLFHMIYNGLEIGRSRVGSSLPTDGPLGWFVSVRGGDVQYLWPTLCLSALVAIVLLRWLVNQSNETGFSQPEKASDPTPESCLDLEGKMALQESKAD